MLVQQHSLQFIDFNLLHNEAHSYLIVIQENKNRKLNLNRKQVNTEI